MILRYASSWFLGAAVVSAAYAAGCGAGSGANGGSGGEGDGGTIGDGSSLGLGGDATLGNGEDGGSGGPDGSGGANPCVAPTKLVIAPPSETASVSVGTPFAQSFTATATYAGGASADVTAQTFFTSSNATLGTMAGATFTWGGVNGGTTTVSGKTCGVTSNTTLTLKLAAVFGSGGGDDGGAGSGSFDAGGEPGAFGDAGVTSNPNCDPTLVYPPDGVLLPPNTNVIEIQFLPGSSGGAANTDFQISFENAATDVKIYTTCVPLNGGCVFDLTQTEWNYIAQTNAGGDPLAVEVSGLGCDGNNAGASNTRNISFAEQPLAGTIYYWASINTLGTSEFSGGVFRYDFGVRGQTADPVLTPTYGGNGLCIGCHDISRDGRLMLFDYDDNDADDEYTDVNTDVFDVAARTFATTGTLSKGQAFEPGFHTWNRPHSLFLLSDGAHVTKTSPQNPVAPNGSFTVRGADAGFVGLTPPPPPVIRGTTPDMAPDDSNVVFVAAPNDAGALLADGGTVAGYLPLQGTSDPEQDLWFAGASVYVAPWNVATSQLGTEALLIPSNGTNNFYYPSYSPEGSLIAFNYAPSGPNFHNPLARVQLVPTGVANPTPDDLANLNNDPTNGGQVTNSWARWSPFVQSYKGGQILWLTMSSTRDYGLRIENDGDENCYPTEGPAIGATGGGPPPPPPPPGGVDGGPIWGRVINQTNSPACTRSQLWMAAIKLDAAGVAAGQDVSFPPFWLPFQDMTTNNHLGQWAQQAFSGTCNAAAADAGAAPDAGGCAPGLCCFSGGCATCLTPPAPPPPSPPPDCAITANCATGTCCNSGLCGACGGSGDGGGSSNDSGSSGNACNTCLDCNSQACNAGQCGSCTNSAQCCAPLECSGGQCVLQPK
jgi:hypothetical protein